MVSALFDTNILIDYLNGIEQARVALERHPDQAISLVTWMEVMVGATPETEEMTRRFLDGFVMLPVDERIGETAVTLRKQYRIKLPEAIVWATAQINRRILITRNTKDFAREEPGVHIPYQIEY